MDNVTLLPLVARWWWLLALSTIAAGVAGHQAVTRVPKTYQAEVQTLVGPVNTDVSLDVSGGLAGTYADLAMSQRLLDQTIGDTGSDLTTTELKEATSVISNAVTRIIKISVQSRDSTRAALLANALARRLVALSTAVEATSQGVVKAFESQQEFRELRPGIQARMSRAARRVFGPSAAGRVTIIDPARPPETAVKPVVPLIVALAAIGGLLVSVIFVLFREARRATRHDPPVTSKPEMTPT